MKVYILFGACILLLPFFCIARMDCLYTCSKGGVTLHFGAPCNAHSQAFGDSLLTEMLSSINRRDTSVKIVVNINELLFSPQEPDSDFVSIAFDTLRDIDDEFIFDYYWSRGITADSSQAIPLDINASRQNKTKEVGVKIFYNRWLHPRQIIWSEVEKLIAYAAQNVDGIKAEQRRDTVRYDGNGWYVSLLTLKPAHINRIMGRSRPTQAKGFPSGIPAYFLIIAAAGIALLVAIVVWKYGFTTDAPR